MSPETILYIVIAAIVSFGISSFMYGYRSKYTGRLRWLFAGLRSVTLFSLLLLLLNPKFTSTTFVNTKPSLSVVTDNSFSIKAAGKDLEVKQLLEGFKNNGALNKAFDISYYTLGEELNALDSLSFSEQNTNIAKALSQTDALGKGAVAPTVLITDGNQTLGSDYEFSSASLKQQVFPLIVGDSTAFTDLKISQLNSNRYAFLKNNFPVEATVVYTGNGRVRSKFIVAQGSNTVFTQNLTFSETDNAQTVSFNLRANSVGVQKYTAQIVPLPDEKNKTNNVAPFAVEVVDQATNVLVVSDISHPDLGALKKAVQRNEQRTLTLKKPEGAVAGLDDYQLVILYQPGPSFAAVHAQIEKLKKNTLLITGAGTHWDFLNSAQTAFKKDAANQPENVGASLNDKYTTFAVENIGFEAFPPLRTHFGELRAVVPHGVLLGQAINGFLTGSPMLATTELNGRRSAIWDGTGFWKWRAQTFLKNGSFQAFDAFIDKLVQYLASAKRRSRLEVESKTFYYSNSEVAVSAQYFDKNYVFDPRAQLNITVTNTGTDQRTVFPMLLKNNFFQVGLNTLPAGEYKFTVAVKNETVARSGGFSILDYNVEQQFLHANVAKLRTLAKNTAGRAYFAHESVALATRLLTDNRFSTIQKNEQKTVPLIDWKYLLALLVLSLSAEWFIRKYNGLI